MVLTKDELISALNGEIRLLLHLTSKVDPTKLDYRPSPQQRSTLELLQYMTIMPEIHLRSALADAFDMGAFGSAWTSGEAAAKTRTLDQVKDEIGKQPALFAKLLEPCSDAVLRGPLEMFGQKLSRGAWLVNLVLVHYAAYRMQLFLYLKASGRSELNTLNLWAGMDGKM